jgi:hypothetical protein
MATSPASRVAWGRAVVLPTLARPESYHELGAREWGPPVLRRC